MTHWPYLPFLLVWALPVLLVQWLVGARYLWRGRRSWPWLVLGLGAYFTLADAIAIIAGIWRFDRTALAGPALGPVPIEEILFYLLTAAMVVQGFVVAWGVWEERTTVAARWRGRLARWRGNHGAVDRGDLTTGSRPRAADAPPQSRRAPDA
jgi:putative membrane protein